MSAIFDRPYHHMTKRVLMALGAWSYQSSVRNVQLRSLTTFTVLSIFIPQLAHLLETLHDLDNIVECLPLLGFCLGAITKLYNLLIHQENIKYLIENLERDWTNATSNRDVEILNHYGRYGWIARTTYAGLMFGALSIYFTAPITPKFLDLLYPLNESRPHVFLFKMEYFIDQDEYYLFTVIHAYLAIPFGLSTIVYIDGIFFIFIQHACAMLEILKCRLESLHVNDVTAVSHEMSSEFKDVFGKLVECVELQLTTIEFISILDASHTMAFLLILATNSLILIMTAVVIVTKLDQPEEAFRIFLFNAGAIFHLFYHSWQAQLLKSQSETVMISAYLGNWYEIHYILQRMMILLIIRSSKPSQITAGPFYVICMESFGMVGSSIGFYDQWILSVISMLKVLRACMSVITLLLSFR